MRFFLTLILSSLPLIAAPDTAAFQAQLQLKGCEFESVESQSTFTHANERMELSSLSCKNGKDNYLLLHNGDAPNILWTFKYPATRKVSKIVWLDLDEDALSDLLVFYEGGVLDAFINRIDLTRKNRGSMKQIVHGDAIYVSFVDLDHNGRPELIKVTDAGRAKACSALILPEGIQEQIQSRFQSLSGKYSESQPGKDRTAEALFAIYQKAIFLGVKGKNPMFIDMTSNFQDHVAWRVSILEKILRKRDGVKWPEGTKPEDMSGCYSGMEDTIKYWKSKVRVKSPRKKRRRH